ncbi:ABC transporter family substrate-binding protein [Streptomyces sp. NBC_01795]|uniref:ABC transporter family substrate-binding protein n=1 Tax=unclassified Streptomyces TaxID=2593676 RepID=UPI002DDADEC9|nr:MULTISPECIES: ABC transporter family substrate-binding protein [unclassified Streptomyces]WSA92560.1 ABC transporter family substrate-binding protein [Streptomyces sp. NBC_01795]WSS14800.1 ABC transporter family substrate-binding protein [Streptomyces sp. NBC_01186]
MRAVPAESDGPAKPAPSARVTRRRGAFRNRRTGALRTARTFRRTSAVLVAGALLPLPLAGAGTATGAQAGAAHDATGDIRTTDRQEVSSGGTVRWAVDAAPTTFNAFQPDAGEATAKVTGATLPSLFTLDEQGAPQANEDYLRSAEVTKTEPRQTVVYKLSPRARWSNGRAVSTADFRAQWKALRGKDDAYWAARNAGYDRIRSVTRGEGAREVKVVFAKPYADWRSLFTPLYPRQAMRSPKAFNDRTRDALPAAAGPFRVAGKAGGAKGQGGKRGTTVLERNPHWWGERAKLSRIELKAVPRHKRAKALANGKLDLADVDEASARRIGAAHHLGGPQRPRTRHGDKQAHKAEHKAHKAERAARRRAAALPKGLGKALRKYEVRKALDSAYTQLSLNGSSGPLADDRVRRAVARALDRDELAHKALGRVGLPDEPLGNHLRMANQDGYKDNSDAAGGMDIDSAQSLLADAGWKTGGSLLQGKAAGAKKPGGKKGHGKHGKDGRHGKKPGGGPAAPPGEASSPDAGASAPYRAEAEASVVRLTRAQMARVTGKPLSLAASATSQRGALLAQAAHADLEQARLLRSPRKLSRARAALATAQNVRATAGELQLLTRGKSMAVRTKNGKPLALRFVLPGGPGSAPIRVSGERIADMLNGVGIRTQIKEVPNESYFKDHIAAGEYDLALFSWPASAYPATETKPIFSKPQPAADGSLLVEQNYARIGTDQIDQLFEQAAGELDDGRRRELVGKADARIWAVAGSVPLYQRPQLVAARRALANAGAFGFATPRYQDIGYHKG